MAVEFATRAESGLVPFMIYRAPPLRAVVRVSTYCFVAISEAAEGPESDVIAQPGSERPVEGTVI